MIIDYDRRPNATEDEKLQSLVENIQLALNSIDAGTLTGNITNNVSINAGTLNGTIDGDYLFVKNLDADSITAVKGWIDKLLVQTHLLANEGEVFELDAIQVNASRIKAGTLDVERLIYTNQTTGEKYLVHFDPDGSTAYEKLDGNVIEDLTITADKIVSESIMARHITTQNLEGTGGWINLRNGTFFYGNGATYAAANNAISWDGSKLKIKADDFELSSGKSIFEEIEAIETWFYAVAPTTTNEPAKNWNTEKLKELHLRDIYFDTTSGKSYRWAKDGTTYKWVEIEDVELAAVTRRLSDAETSITKNADSIVSLASANETYVKPDGTTATNKLRTQIKQNADAIALKANSKDVYTKAETDAAITVSAQGIEQTVSSTYETKTDASSKLNTAKTYAEGKASTAEANAKADTTEKLKSYYTKTQTDSQITQTANSITSTVSSTYETKNDATSKLNTAKGYTDSEITSAKAAIKITTDEISSEVSKKTDSEKIISTIRQSAESVKIKASQVEIDGTATFNAIKNEVENTANTAVDNIEVGGRNLARGTADMIKGSGAWSTGTWRDSGASNTYNYTVSDSPVASVSKGVLVTTKVANARYGVCQDNCPMLSKKVTFSVWAKGTAGGTIRLQAAWWSGIPGATHNTLHTIATGDWQYITFTADLTNATAPNGKCSISYLYWLGVNVNDTCVFIAPKLEYGTKATDWTPAPEDVQGEIDAKKNLHTLMSSSSGSTYANILKWSKEGRTNADWAINTTETPLTNVKVGDTCRVAYKITDMGDENNRPYAYVIGEVTNVESAKIYMTMHGLDSTVIDGGNILTNSIGAGSIKVDEIEIGAAQIKSGTIDSARIPKLSADKINVDEIEIGAAQIKSGTIDSARIPNLSADKINSGTINIGRIPDGALNSKIEVGGRNLLGGTANAVVPVLSTGDANNSFGSVARYSSPASEYSLENYDETSKSMVITSSVTGNRGIGWYTHKGDVVAGETYTFSCRVKSNVATTVHTHTAWRSGSATAGYTGWTSGGSISLTANKWTDYSYTFTPDTAAKLDWEFMVSLCFTGKTTGVTCRIAHAKFEKGNKATDWSLAPAELAATATSYITDIDSQNGITIKAVNGKTDGSDDTKKNYIKLNADGLDVYKGGASVAKYGDTARIGKSGQQRVEVTSSAVEIHDASGAVKLKTTTDGLDIYGSGSTTLPVAKFKGDGVYCGIGEQWGVDLSGSSELVGLGLSVSNVSYANLYLTPRPTAGSYGSFSIETSENMEIGATEEIFLAANNIVFNAAEGFTCYAPNNILWNGTANYMGSGQSITLSDNVSNQLTGIVLAWSRYADGAAQNDSWFYQFVPKWHVSAHSGNGIHCSIPVSNTSNTVCNKYVYITDTKITGHADNTKTGTGYANNARALRAVLGV